MLIRTCLKSNFDFLEFLIQFNQSALEDSILFGRPPFSDIETDLAKCFIET